MYFGSILFAGYPTFQADTVEQLEHHLATHLRAKIVNADAADRSMGVVCNRWALASSEIWFSSNVAPFSVALPDGDYLRVQFCQQGGAQVRVGNRGFDLTASQGCVSLPAAEITYGGNFRQLIWRVRREALIRRLTAITGRYFTSDLSFDQALPLDTPEGQQLRSMLECVMQILSLPRSFGADRMLADLESGLITAFLYAGNHIGSSLLRTETRGIAPWQVRRAEAFIEANCQRTLSIDEIVSATGVSARSLYRIFRSSRGYTPQEFLRQMRLRRADELLRAPDTVSVTDVAFACGFSDLSRFSREFAKTFGATPSSILRQNRSGSSLA